MHVQNISGAGVVNDSQTITSQLMITLDLLCNKRTDRCTGPLLDIRTRFAGKKEIEAR